MRHMGNSEVNGILARIRKLRNFNTGGEMLGNHLIDSMCEYTKTVFDHNFTNANAMNIRENSNSVLDYQDTMGTVDAGRRSAHDTLITWLGITDRFCRNNGLEEIFGELPEEYREDTSNLIGKENRDKPGVRALRHEIADWTWGFMIAGIISMDIDISGMDVESKREDFMSVGRAYNKSRAKGLLDELTR